MMARVSRPMSTHAAGSVGTVDTQYLDLPTPLPLDCGRRLHPVRIAYETYGTLSPARDNVILVCHALSGDAHAAGFSRTPIGEGTRDGFGAEDRDGTSGRGLGWWDGMIGPGKAFDTNRFFVVSTNLLGGCRGTTGPSSTNPETGRPYGSDFPCHYGRRHGSRGARLPRRDRDRAPCRRCWRIARRNAGARMGHPVSRSSRLDRRHREHTRRAAAGSRVERHCAQRDYRRSGLAGGPLLRDGTRAECRNGRGADGWTRHLSLCDVGGGEVRQTAAIRRGHSLQPYGARVSGRELSAPPGRHVRQTLRREHVSIHVAGADVFRSRSAIWRRFSGATH